MTGTDDVDRLQQSFAAVVRALGLLRPDTTPCGQQMSTTEAHAVDELRCSGPCTQTQLADALRLQKSTVSRLVDQLEARDLVVRTPNPGDHRSHLVELTANGATRAERLVDARRVLFADLLGFVDPADRSTVIDGLIRLEEAARARR
jgi:DNA-binding MarR family transcriptional regulator